MNLDLKTKNKNERLQNIRIKIKTPLKYKD